jgi:hypothetical protein
VLLLKVLQAYLPLFQRPSKNNWLPSLVFLSLLAPDHVSRSSTACLKVKFFMSQSQVNHVSRSSKTCLKVKLYTTFCTTPRFNSSASLY